MLDATSRNRSVDYVILGAGIAGMTMQHVLKGESVALIDPSPGKYKIGESIIPQHFIEPEVRPLFEIVQKLPSACPKDGTLFIAEDSVGAFAPFEDAGYTIHVARQELEAATAAFFQTEVIRERVESVDVESRTVTTDQGTFHARKLIIDCSGPARIVGRAVGVLREVWPVWASWAYHDVLEADEERFLSTLRRGDKEFYRFNDDERRLEESTNLEGFRSTKATILTRVRDGMWTWQIPLHGGSMLSVGCVSRHGPVSEEEYLEVTKASIGPQFTTRLRPWNDEGPHNRFHVRNRFAWAADRFAGEGWALVGDAAFFGDPVYSVGTGFATNHAIQLGRVLKEYGWTTKIAAAHQQKTAFLYERAKRAYDSWYFGRVLEDTNVANEIQTNFLNGRAFQVETVKGYVEAWLFSHPQDAYNEISPRHGDDVAEQIAPMLEEGGGLAGWRLAAARAFKQRLELDWERPDAPPMSLRVEPLAPGQPAYKVIDGLGLSYRPPKGNQAKLSGQSLALVNAFAKVVTSEAARMRAIMADAMV